MININKLWPNALSESINLNKSLRFAPVTCVFLRICIAFYVDKQLSNVSGYSPIQHSKGCVLPVPNCLDHILFLDKRSTHYEIVQLRQKYIYWVAIASYLIQNLSMPFTNWWEAHMIVRYIKILGKFQVLRTIYFEVRALSRWLLLNILQVKL